MVESIVMNAKRVIVTAILSVIFIIILCFYFSSHLSRANYEMIPEGIILNSRVIEVSKGSGLDYNRELFLVDLNENGLKELEQWISGLPINLRESDLKKRVTEVADNYIGIKNIETWKIRTEERSINDGVYLNVLFLKENLVYIKIWGT